MRVAVFVDRFLAVSESFILRQILGLLERGLDVDIFATAPEDPRDLNPDVRRYGLTARVSYLRGSKGRVPRALKAMWLTARAGRRVPAMMLRAAGKDRRSALSLDVWYAVACLSARRTQYDIVHCQYGPLGLFALRLRRIGAISGKLLTSFRGYDATKYLQARPGRYEELFRDGELFCPVSESLKRVLVAEGCDPEKIVVHRTGVDCARLTFATRRRGPDEPTRLLTVARLVEKKGLAYAIEAAARLIRQGYHISYTIAGDGPLRAELEDLIAEPDLRGRVTLLGWADGEGVRRLLQQAHILVAPSVTADDGDQEGIPNVLKEAMATGLPVVSTWHGGIPELVEDGVSGFLVPERDVEALTERMKWLIDRPEVWPVMGSAGRLKVEREFDLPNLNDELVGLYRRLVERDPERRERA